MDSFILDTCFRNGVVIVDRVPMIYQPPFWPMAVRSVGFGLMIVGSAALLRVVMKDLFGESP